MGWYLRAKSVAVCGRRVAGMGSSIQRSMLAVDGVGRGC